MLASRPRRSRVATPRRVPRALRLRHLLAVLLLAPGVALADGPFILDAAEWARPRSGEAVAAMPTVREAVHIWSQTPSAALAIRHPRGEAGVLWAEELRDWLVALGVPSAGIDLRASSGLEGRMELDIVRASGGST
jgi:hypothetical protein